MHTKRAHLAPLDEVLTGMQHVQFHLEKNISHRKRDENYGRVVLHRHNSHDALDR
ncbi:hypothetical protein G4228_017715 [Cervus hanglu yarkandensis]|nr:hypothetical protein G4228_017715 [Cervus hanglu yarkandensis]